MEPNSHGSEYFSCIPQTPDGEFTLLNLDSMWEFNVRSDSSELMFSKDSLSMLSGTYFVEST